MDFKRVFLEHKRKTFINKERMCFYIDNNESKMWLVKKYWYVSEFGDFWLLIEPAWDYIITLKDNTSTKMKGFEVIEKLQAFIRKSK